MEVPDLDWLGHYGEIMPGHRERGWRYVGCCTLTLKGVGAELTLTDTTTGHARVERWSGESSVNHSTWDQAVVISTTTRSVDAVSGCCSVIGKRGQTSEERKI